MLCEYRHVFGAENTGVHSIRFLGVAAVDVALTVAAAYAAFVMWGWSFWKTLAILFIAGIVVHRLFCVNTAVNTKIFGLV